VLTVSALQLVPTQLPLQKNNEYQYLFKTSMLLNDKNYQVWAKAAIISLKGKGKLGYINGTRPRPVTK
jgi:gag-polypeptide of LTR copia-type